MVNLPDVGFRWKNQQWMCHPGRAATARVAALIPTTVARGYAVDARRGASRGKSGGNCPRLGRAVDGLVLATARREVAMSVKDKLEIGLKPDAPYRPDNLPEHQKDDPDCEKAGEPGDSAAHERAREECAEGESEPGREAERRTGRTTGS
jgi:hypothetical protein